MGLMEKVGTPDVGDSICLTCKAPAKREGPHGWLCPRCDYWVWVSKSTIDRPAAVTDSAPTHRLLRDA